jgi:hypothetical protein
MTDDGSKTAHFDFDGKTVQVTHTPPMWQVRSGDQVGDSRRLDEALESLFGRPPLTSRSTALVRLSVEILQWADPHSRSPGRP